METRAQLAVSNQQALRFFFEHLRDVTELTEPPERELLYNASLLAHFATTSTASVDTFPPCPTSLSNVFDLFVMDRSQADDPEIMEAAGSQCLLLTGFFLDQQRTRHQVDWYATLGAGFYERAARVSRDRSRSQMLAVMARRFPYWREQQHRLAIDLREAPLVIPVQPRTKWAC
jgi:hypothetical protein